MNETKRAKNVYDIRKRYDGILEEGKKEEIFIVQKRLLYKKASIFDAKFDAIKTKRFAYLFGH